MPPKKRKKKQPATPRTPKKPGVPPRARKAPGAPPWRGEGTPRSGRGTKMPSSRMPKSKYMPF